MPNEESEGKTLRSEVEAERKRKKQRMEKAGKTLSKKKLRKEAKRQKKEMADRNRKDVEETRLKNLVMAIPEVQSAEMKDMSLDEGKERTGERMDGGASVAVVVVSLDMANSSADATIKSLETKTSLNTRPVFSARLDWYKYQPRVRREEQQTSQPGRHENLTLAERDRLEEERRRRRGCSAALARGALRW